MKDFPLAGSPLLVGYARSHPDRFALAAAQSGIDTVEALLSQLPDDVKPSVVVGLPLTLAAALIERAPDERLRKWLAGDDVAAAVGLSRRIPDQRYAGLAEGLRSRRRRELEAHRSYANDVAGAHVDVHVPFVRDTTPVADAAHILDIYKSSPRIPLLVLDSKDRYLGWFDAELALQKGLSARAGNCLGSSAPLSATANLRTARARFATSGDSWLPVVDARTRLVGVLHRSRLPKAASPGSHGDPALVVSLAAAMFQLLGELPEFTGKGKEMR